MAKIALIGYTGFVGSYLRSKLPSNIDLYNSQNISTIHNKIYDIVYFAGLPATKWLINKDPQRDIKNLLSIQHHLLTVNVNKFILISTIDVYDNTYSCQSEDFINITTESYGKHRYIMEEWVKIQYEDHHIIRLPALFGLGLKKNIIYDILSNNQKNHINCASIFQWYSLEDLYKDIEYVIDSNIKVINLFSEPILTYDLITNCFPNENSLLKQNNSNIITYNQHTNHGIATKYYWDTQTSILKKLNNYINLYNKTQKASKNLAISNLAWNIKYEDKALHIISRYGIKYVELAITKYHKWSEIHLDDLMKIKKRFNDYGLSIYSLQAIMYGTDINIFLNENEFCKHMKQVITIARVLGASRLVFGSPKNRKIPEGTTQEEATKKFIKCFKSIGDYAKMNNIIICIEPNAKDYGCNFITNITEGINIIKKIDHPSIMLNLDTGNAIMENDSINLTHNIKYIGHVQISEPNLKEFVLSTSSTDSVDFNANFSKQLKKFYKNVISLEMCEVNEDNFERNIRQFIDYYA